MYKIYADDVLIYSDDDSGLHMRHVTAPLCTQEIGRSGGLTFSIYPTHPQYNSLKKFKTKIQAKMGSKTIFEGRIIDDQVDLYNTKSITCEGKLSFLIDSFQSPRPGNVTVRHFLTSCLAEHNQQVEVEKQFTIGNVTVDEAEEEINQNIDSYQETKGAIDQMLIGIYGGYLVVRHEDGVNYIDYLKEYPTTETPQEVRLKKNILDLTKKDNISTIFSVLTPVGKYPDDYQGERSEDGIMTIESVNDGKKYLEHAATIEKYGKISRAEQFNNPKSPQELLEAAQAFMTRHLDPERTHLSVKAIDMHLLDAGVEQFTLGNRYTIISESNDLNTTLTLVSIKYDFQNPDKTELVFENPIQEKGEKVLKKESSLSRLLGGGGGRGGGGGGLGNLYKHITEGDDWLQLMAKQINLIGETIGIEATQGIGLKVAMRDEIFALINLDQTGATIFGKQISLLGENGFKFTAGVHTDKDLQFYVEDTYTELEATREYIRTKVVHEDELVSLINQNKEGVQIYGKNVDLLGEHGFKFTAGGVIDPEDLAFHFNKTYTQLDATDEHIRTKVVHEEELVSLINQNKEGVQVYGKNVEIVGANGIQLTAGGSSEVDPITGDIKTILDGVFSRIKQRKDEIDLRVEKNGIIAAITLSPELAKIEADKIDLDGIVTAKSLVVSGELSAVNASLENLKSGTTVATQLRAAHILSTGALGVNGQITAGSISSTGSIASGVEIIAPNIYGTNIYMGGVLLSTLLDAKLSTSGTANNSGRLGGELPAYYAKQSSIDNIINIGLPNLVTRISNLENWAANHPGGPRGYTGSRGMIGTTGTPGDQGPPGIQGARGYTGSQGDVGPEGIAGLQGLRGYTGSQGDVGPEGVGGTSGPRGYTGSQGDVGPEGIGGTSGPIGYTGSRGAQGVIGYTGSRGSVGPEGIAGTSGAQGPIGYTGSRGGTGSQGYTGSRGSIGTTGTTGDQGPPGIQGPRGYTGSRGSTGFTGSRGIPST